MAKVEVQKSEVRCDRCDKRIVKERPRVALTPLGPASLAIDGSADDVPAIDLCSICHASIVKWWERKAVEK